MALMRIKVASVRTAAPYKLVVQFNDGSFGTHDCAGMVRERGELLEALRDRNYFGRVTLENGVPTWPNYFDISPEWLQTEMTNRGELRRPLAPRGRRAGSQPAS
jgi:hypothetical protein